MNPDVEIFKLQMKILYLYFEALDTHTTIYNISGLICYHI